MLWRSKETYMLVSTSHFKTGIFALHCYPCQACWPVSFHGLFRSTVVPAVCYHCMMKLLRSRIRSSLCMADTLTRPFPQLTCLVLGKIVVKLAHGASSLTVVDKTEPPWGFGRPWSSQELPAMCVMHLVCSWLELASWSRADHFLLCVHRHFSCVPALPAL